MKRARKGRLRCAGHSSLPVHSSAVIHVGPQAAAAVVAADLAQAPFQPTLATKHRQEHRQAGPSNGAGASGGADGAAPMAASTAATTAEAGAAGSKGRAPAPASEPAPAAEPPRVFSGNASTRAPSGRQARCAVTDNGRGNVEM